jgi:hypothetical protein
LDGIDIPCENKESSLVATPNPERVIDKSGFQPTVFRGSTNFGQNPKEPAQLNFPPFFGTALFGDGNFGGIKGHDGTVGDHVGGSKGSGHVDTSPFQHHVVGYPGVGDVEYLLDDLVGRVDANAGRRDGPSCLKGPGFNPGVAFGGVGGLPGVLAIVIVVVVVTHGAGRGVLQIPDSVQTGGLGGIRESKGGKGLLQLADASQDDLLLIRCGGFAVVGATDGVQDGLFLQRPRQGVGV